MGLQVSWNRVPCVGCVYGDIILKLCDDKNLLGSAMLIKINATNIFILSCINYEFLEASLNEVSSAITESDPSTADILQMARHI